MDIEALLSERGMDARRILIATVGRVRDDATVDVWCNGAADEEFHCRLLQTCSGEQLALEPGDTVLAWIEASQEGWGVILGRIGASREPREVRVESEVPDEVVISAKSNLRLTCGSASITIRADGKILIKGKDLVSHAQRLNRIKGGAVQIN